MSRAFASAFVFAFASLASSSALADPSTVDPASAVERSPEPAAPPAAADEPASPAPSPTTARGIVGGGLSTASLFGVSSTAMHASLGVGVERGRAYIPVTLDLAIGQTRRELSAGEVKACVGVLGILGRVRLGAELGLGYGWLGRAPSSAGSHIGMYAIDLAALATLDVVDIGERRAIYLGVKPSVGARWGESVFALDHIAVAWRAGALAGARF